MAKSCRRGAGSVRARAQLREAQYGKNGESSHPANKDVQRWLLASFSRSRRSSRDCNGWPSEERRRKRLHPRSRAKLRILSSGDFATTARLRRSEAWMATPLRLSSMQLHIGQASFIFGPNMKL